MSNILPHYSLRGPLIICCLLFGLPLTTMGQLVAPSIYDHRGFDLVEDSLCYVEAPEGYLDAFWWHAHTKPNGKTLSIVHLGDSHVQSGYFTQPIRQYFDFILGSGRSSGFAAPYSLFRGNQPSHIQVKTHGRQWGGSLITRRKYESDSPTGLLITSRSKQAQSVSFTVPDSEPPFQRIIVYRSNYSQPFYLKGFSQLPTASRHEGATSWVVDSLLLPFPVRSAEVVVPPLAEWYGVSVETAVANVVVHTIGHNGAFYATYNKSPFLTHMLQAFEPSLVIVSLGTNESLVRNFDALNLQWEVRHLVQTIKRERPQAAVVLTAPLYAARKSRSHNSYNASSERVSEQLRACAKEVGCGFIDLFHIFGGKDSYQALEEMGILSRDRIHLTKEGYHIIGEVVALALSRDLQRFLSTTPLITVRIQ